MSDTYRPRGSLTDLIEQAAARGQTPDEIADQLGVTGRLVDEVLARMDRVAGEGKR